MISYKELGFVNTRAMFKKAYAEGYAVPAFNFVALEQMLAIVTACMDSNTPFILQASANVHRYLGSAMVQSMARGCVELMKQAGKVVPMVLHLDHGMSYEECISAINEGFSSVMIDGAALPYEENIELTARVVAYARRHDVTVEGELGTLSGVEDEVVHPEARYTDPAQVEDFVKRTGVDSLAISIGNSHGIVKFKTRPDGPPPGLRFDILADIERRLPGFPIVLHGASSILPQYVDMVNTYGGQIEEAQGIPEEQVKRAAKTAVCKINIASDGWIVMTAAIRKALAENPGVIDPRQYLFPAREEMINMYKRKNIEIFGSAGKA